MKNVIAAGAASVLLWSTVPRAQTAPAGAQESPPSSTQSAAAPSIAAEAAPPAGGLNELAAMTFGCPKAALNAAAREAAKVRSNGTYQFAFFKIVSDSHHAAYEVHFKSNYAGEKDLKYCVAIYCQQGWDPATAKTSVTLMTNRPGSRPAAHGASQCSARKKSTGSPNKN
jgi:hypothetical protein